MNNEHQQLYKICQKIGYKLHPSITIREGDFMIFDLGYDFSEDEKGLKGTIARWLDVREIIFTQEFIQNLIGK